MKPLEPTGAEGGGRRAESRGPASGIRPPSDGEAVNSELVNAEPGTPATPIHDCWNLIGVEGNGTCRELLKFIHCRNCPVYAAAGIQLLDRPLPAEFRRERAAHYAQAKKVAQPERFSVVIFRLAHEWLALHTTVFQEVAEHRGMHSLPHRRRGVALGLVNVRGELLICASVARLLGLEAEVRGQKSEVRSQNSDLRSPSSGFPRLLVTNWNGLRLAFPVDEVQGIQRFPKAELKSPPATISKSTLGYTQGVFGWRDRTVGLLDTEPFFTTLNRSLAL